MRFVMKIVKLITYWVVLINNQVFIFNLRLFQVLYVVNKIFFNVRVSKIKLKIIVVTPDSEILIMYIYVINYGEV